MVYGLNLRDSQELESLMVFKPQVCEHIPTFVLRVFHREMCKRDSEIMQTLQSLDDVFSYVSDYQLPGTKLYGMKMERIVALKL